jgi:hypothetical protein
MRQRYETRGETIVLRNAAGDVIAEYPLGVWQDPRSVAEWLRDWWARRAEQNKNPAGAFR